MPLSSVWALVIGLVLLALGLTLKNAEIRHTLKSVRDELSAARSEISTLNDKQQKQIQEIKANHDARIDELSQTIFNLQNELDHINKSPVESKNDESLNPDALFTKSIISHIIKNKSINQPSTPRILSRSLKLSPECLLSHMMKMHNDKLITFITGGKQPDVDTDFFLSPEE